MKIYQFHKMHIVKCNDIEIEVHTQIFLKFFKISSVH